VEGTPFGRYRLIELLGRGGMGEVWRAQDTAIDRVVALKVLLPHYAQDRTFNQRFRREARAAARLDDPHVVPIYDVGEQEGRLYVTMRLIKGRDLQALIDDGPLEPKRAVAIIDQVATALDAAHRVQLVHRDIKPSNILITDNDFTYLIDFGIARAIGETGLTSTGFTLGTWSYMAPERFRDGQVGPSSDIYALACVLYQCVTAQLPFPGTTFEQVAMGHMNDPPPKPSAQHPGIPAAMDDVIKTGLAKDPGRRYQTALELAASARSAVTDPEATTQFDVVDVEKERRSKNPPKSLANRLGVSKGTAVMAITFAALLVVVLVGVIASLHIKHESPRPTPQMTSDAPRETSGPAASAPPSPPVVLGSAVDSILLSTAEVNQIVGTSSMRLEASQYGMSENAGGLGVKPAECAGVVHGSDRTVWVDTGFEAMRDQTYTQEYPGVPDSAGVTPYQIEQVVVVFPGAEQAQAVLASSQRQWQSCAGGTVSTVYNGIGESTRGYILGAVQRQGDVMSVSMASYSDENGADACQQVLGVRINVIVRTGTCTRPNVTNANRGLAPPAVASPTWAIDYAERLATAMLARVKT
jgi:serine/threonine protein kinase